MLLAIETSCDETALAIADVAAFLSGERRRDRIFRAEIVSSQVSLHEPYGGVVPELAAREHLLNLPPLVQELFSSAKCSSSDIRAVAVTRGPGLNGCLLVGLSFAKSFAMGRSLPLLALNHLEGHLFACELEESIREIAYPALALLVSGGHTELILLRSFRDYETVSRTRDDAVGEAFDKAATLLGLPYPGGPALARAAVLGQSGRFELPVGMPRDAAAFSFSGVKTALLRLVEKLGDEARELQTMADLARAVEDCFVMALTEKTKTAVAKHRPRELILTGGVAANATLRSRLGSLATVSKIGFRVPELRWCTDNAAMLGMLALRVVERDEALRESWAGEKPLLGKLRDNDEIGSMPRWPLSQLHT